MRRRFNYTGRKRIHHQDVAITLAEVDGNSRFYANINLNEYGLPDDARVWVEAYDRNAFMRFNFGSVGDLRATSATVLSSFNDISNIYFRVKVTAGNGSGQLLALAKSINPSSQDENDESRRSILRVAYDDLEGRPWKLEILSDEYPILVIDKSIESATMLVRSNKFFFACVYPSILESILIHILIIANYLPGSSNDESDEWMDSWIDFASNSPGAPRVDFSELLSEEAKREWITQVVAAFSRDNGAIRKLRSALEET